MAYLSLYRKWRPQTFSEAVGQEHIVRTLSNALDMGRVVHAYLFAGPRGTGKTTFARLLAKGLNCTQGPTSNPCNQCANCNRITQGMAVDVIEIDGASNRGIDEIRELRERVRYAPTEGGFKVYIIDEVHMLTNEAFNALLKVLEEPPEHVIFVFATTEAHKVPATILSRCQKFDFRRFRSSQLAAHLKHVAHSEGVSVEEHAIALIARHAEGGMRDALAIMDQCLAADPSHLSAATVVEVLGIVRREALIDMVGHILHKDLPAALHLMHALLNEGVESRQLVKDLAAYARDLVLMKAAPDLPDLLTAEEAERERMRQQANQSSLSQLLIVVNALVGADAELRWATSPAMAVEMALVRAIDSMDGQPDTQQEQSAESARTLWDSLERRVRSLEEALISRTPATSGPPGGTEVDEEGPDGLRRRSAVLESLPASQPASPRPQPDAAAVRGEDDLLKLQSEWPAVLKALKEDRMISTEAYLRVGVPGAIEGQTVVVYFAPGYRFHQANIEDPGHKNAVEKVISRILGREVRVRTAEGTPAPAEQPKDEAIEATASSESGGPAPTPAETEGEASALGAGVGEDILQSPAVQKALKYLGGRVVGVETYEKDGDAP